MNISTLIQSLENKITSLDSKKKVAIDKGQMELFNIFNEEQNDTKLTLELVKMATLEIQTYKNETVRNKLIAHVLEELPDLALYFKGSSINAVITEGIKKAFDRVVADMMQDKIVSMVE